VNHHAQLGELFSGYRASVLQEEKVLKIRREVKKGIYLILLHAYLFFFLLNWGLNSGLHVC
jgi:hypothetical protein